MINFHIDHRIFQSEILYFDLPLDDPRVYTIKIDERLQYAGIGEYYIISTEDEITDEGMLVKRVGAEASWMRLADKKRVGTFQLDGSDPAEGLFEILLGSGWTSNLVTDDVTTYSMEETDKSVLELIWLWAKITGNEIHFNTIEHTVDILPMVGLDLGLSFRYAKNLQQISRTETPPTVTRWYLFGKNGLTVSALTSGGVPYVEDYSYYTAQGLTLEEARAGYGKDDIFSDESFVEDVPLYAHGQSLLAVTSQPSIVYSAKVVDLSTLVGYNEGGFEPGDTVWVEAEPLSVSERARVSRRDFYPYEGHRDIVELSFNPLLIPDIRSSNERNDTTRNWELFVSKNTETQRQIRMGSQIIGRIKLKTVTDAEWVSGYSLRAVGVGSSTVTLEFFDAETDEPFWTTKTFAVTDGEVVEYTFNWGRKEIPAGTTTLSVRAYSDSLSAGINIEADRTNLWVLARGTTRQQVTLPNSIRFDYTGAVQHWTVPDDVNGEFQVENHAASGNSGAIPGRGCKAIAMFPAIGGTEYDIYVGGMGTSGGPSPAGGWPNGGRGGDTGAHSGGSGGGSTDIRPAGTTMASTLLCTGAGGAAGEPRSSVDNTMYGGDGGFYSGHQGGDNGSGYTNPGTQAAPGDGGTTGWTGGEGAFNQGGPGRDDGNAFRFGGGGAGGGYNGGEGGWSDQVAGGEGIHGPSGGSGGCGYIDPSGWDLEFEDGENSGDGYMIISWETPADID